MQRNYKLGSNIHYLIHHVDFLICLSKTVNYPPHVYQVFKKKLRPQKVENYRPISPLETTSRYILLYMFIFRFLLCSFSLYTLARIEIIIIKIMRSPDNGYNTSPVDFHFNYTSYVGRRNVVKNQWKDEICTSEELKNDDERMGT